jgi:hypothetical protein
LQTNEGGVVGIKVPVVQALLVWLIGWLVYCGVEGQADRSHGGIIRSISYYKHKHLAAVLIKYIYPLGVGHKFATTRVYA